MELINSNILPEQLSYRNAVFEDCELLFSWANDPQTRENSHNTEPIKYNSHVEWLSRKLQSADSWMFIALLNDCAVAVLRLDKENNDLLVSYSVANEYRNKGIGKALVRMMPKIIADEHIHCDRIIAEVFKTNIASNKIFANAGYQVQEKGNLNIYTCSNIIKKRPHKEQKLLIVGTGGQGKVVLDCAYALDRYSHISFLTNDLSAKPIAGFPIFYEQEVVPSFQQVKGRDLSFLKDFDEVIVAIGNNKTRLLMSRQLVDDGVKLATLIHPRATVSKFSDIQAGTVIFANAVINPFAKIGMACIINTGAVVEHDCILGNGVHISPNAAIAGSVIIGEQSWVCVGSSIANNIKIGANSVVGAGGAVLCDVPDYVLVAGIPAVVKKRYDA